MSTIYATRLGFCYQDKYACLLFLKQLRKGVLKELYTDFPVAEQRSLDILLKVGTGESTEERVYEIKTGDKFKNDARRKKSSEIRDVVINFIKYSEESPDFKGYISFSNGLRLQINNYLTPANRLNLSSRMDSSTRAAAKELMTKLRIDEMNTQRDTYDFFRRVKFDPLPYSNDETWTTIDEHIAADIAAIATSLGTNDRTYELPNEYLTAKLLYITQKFTGSGEDVAKPLLAELMDFMALRRLLANYSTTEVPAQMKDNAQRYIQAEMVSKYKVESLLPGPSSDSEELSATDTGIGGVVNV